MRFPLWLVLSLGFLAIGSLSSASDPPNLIFFLSDDHRADFLGCAGHPILKTPHIDALAARGTRFTNACVTTSICAASRASILTGLHERTHRFTFGTPPIPEKYAATSYPAVLRRHGFHTGFIGKFGVAVAARQREAMFDSFIPLNRSPYHKNQDDGNTRHVSQIAGDHAIVFLKKQKRDQPFCLSVSFNAPHAEDGDKQNHYPWPKAVDGLYEEQTVPAPRLSAPRVFASQPDFLKRSMNRDRWYWRWDTPEKYERNVKAYYRMISGVDHVIGRVVDELERLDLAQETIIIFSGDNGYYKGSRGFAGKWSHYEESLRVPLIIYDPRHEREGAVNDDPVLNIDIPATMLEYAGVPTPLHYQGLRLNDLARGIDSGPWRSDSFHEHLFDHPDIPKWEGIRNEDYVYARYFQQEPPFEFLHDMKTDPEQLRNVAGSDACAEILSIMRARCDQRRDELGGAYSLERFPTRRSLRTN